ncbi:response regulator [Synoicihabitans lomoniglobus]|uniref:histidine kinase n=1 Tax=Synoicihabitans lomoniglobus TaxID=2909285 RepID=A0AAE9ZRW2_9BACT|nr:response regulator [Opitutaceae bacterium LMO-M01]WED64110.1 response regulator [Opitutaceae bacterium LMO-M01]
MVLAPLASFAPLAAEPLLVVEDLNAVWTMPVGERELPHPLDVEGRVVYHDPQWGNLWIDQGHDRVRYVRVVAPYLDLKGGESVRLTGTFVPGQGLRGDQVTVERLDRAEPVAAWSTQGRFDDLQRFDQRVVETEAYVDDLQLIDDEHLRLNLIVEGHPVICWVPPTDPAHLPDWRGRFVRLTGLYSARVDPTGNAFTFELWTGREDLVVVLNDIETDARFAGEPTAIGRLRDLSRGESVVISGNVRASISGESIVVRDETGEVLVRSLQRERLPIGTAVDVHGVVAADGAQRIVGQALYRRALGPVASAGSTGDKVIKRVDGLRELSPAEVAAGQPVELAGLVTWSLPEADFFFLQDLGGGVRVEFDADAYPAPPLQKALLVRGVTIATAQGPAVRLTGVEDRGSQAHPQSRVISYDRAASGDENGQWVALRGFVREVISDGDWRWIRVTSPEGEFTAHLQSPVNFVATPGSLIRVQGVCETNVELAHGRVGVLLRVPFLHDITIEEDAPANVYDLPLRDVSELARLQAVSDMVRVRIRARLTHQLPGDYLALEQGGIGLRVLSRNTSVPSPGAEIEAVGILGLEGAHVVLREAAFRQVGTGDPVHACVIDIAKPTDPALDLRLVRVEGRLHDVWHEDGQSRLIMQTGDTIFGATLRSVDDPAFFDSLIDAKLSVTGLYLVQFDDFGRPRAVMIQLRSLDDLVVLESPRWWTAGRALGLATILGACALLVLAWVASLRSRVKTQTKQLMEQMERQRILEADLERGQRLEALSKLTGGIAHDFNNAMTGVTGNLSLALLDPELDDETGACLRDAEAGARRVRQLTKQLATFAEGGAPHSAPHDLSEVIGEALDVALHGSNCIARFEPLIGLRSIMMDREQISRALQNLVMRAREAMPDGGTINVTLEQRKLAADHASELPSGDYLVTRLHDRGAPWSAEQIRSVFDPYAGALHGDDRMAMAMAHSIVRRHGGTLEIESGVTSGTYCTMWLPVSERDDTALNQASDKSTQAAPASPPEPTSEGSDGPMARVLLMDDEPAVRSIAGRVLRHWNYEVEMVAEGETAVQGYEAAAAAGRPFDLVILDLTVPGGWGGLRTLEQLKLIDPDVRSVVASGYADDPVMSDHEQFGFDEAVPKPYDAQALVAAIQRALTRRNPRGHAHF